MDGIKELVQVLVIITVLTVFLEMLLPNGKMHDYVKMVMGLMVIVVVLECGAALVNKDLKFDLPALSQSNGNAGAGLEEIISQGKRLSEVQHRQAMEEYRQGLEKQVLALARLQKDLNVTNAKISTAEAGDRDYGRLTGIVLEVSPGSKEQGQLVPRVKPVEITVGASSPGDGAGGSPAINSKEAAELAKTIANFYNIPLDQVKVVETK